MNFPTQIAGKHLVLQDKNYFRSFHISRRFNAAYVTNPKVACSTLKLTLQRAELEDVSYVPSTSVHDHLVSPLLTVPELNRETLEGALEGRFLFSFVRCPYARLRSAYLNKVFVRKRQGKLRKDAGFSADYCPSFGEFVMAITAQDPKQHNPHWRPQALNLSMGRLRYDFIGKLERFDSDWRHVARACALPETVHKAGRPNHYADHPPLDYTSETETRVWETYQDDFALFGYPRQPV